MKEVLSIIEDLFTFFTNLERVGLPQAVMTRKDHSSKRDASTTLRGYKSHDYDDFKICQTTEANLMPKNILECENIFVCYIVEKSFLRMNNSSI